MSNKVNELAGFSVGDKVMINIGVSPESSKRAGETGVIVEITADSFAGHAGWAYIDDTHAGGVWIDEIEKVDSEDFKIGDEVVLIGHHYSAGNEVEGLQYVVGRKGVILDTSGTYYNVMIEGQNGPWGILPSDLRKVGSEPEEHNGVSKHTSIVVTEGQLSVQHTTNSKRGRVGLLKQG